MNAPVLRITDGTTSIDLLGGAGGYRLKSWVPVRASLKGGGRRASPLADGSQLVTAFYDNAVDTLELVCRGGDMDQVIWYRQELDRLLIKAREYWTTSWQTEPVWIEARGASETNLRYSVIKDYSMPMDDDPYANPFSPSAPHPSVQDELILALEHEGFWRAEEPGTVVELEASASLSSRGQEATIEPDCYVANHAKVAQIDEMWLDNGFIFTGNQIGAAQPYDITPNGAAVGNGDISYFGIDTTVAATSGPFSSLVFDVSTAAVYTGAIGVDFATWQYWNGAWVNLSVYDNTDPPGVQGVTTQPWSQTGVNSIHWEQPSDWTTTAVNGITAYWVRAVFTVGAGITRAQQDNRDVYTVSWPYIDIATDMAAGDEQLYGDVPLLAKIIARGVGQAVVPNIYESAFWFALRSKSRGASFQAFLNFSDEQNQTGITVAAGGVSTAFAANTQAPTGRIAQYSPGAIQAMAQRATITISSSLLPSYYGRFRVFIRYRMSAGADGNIRFRLAVGSRYSPTFEALVRSEWLAQDMGLFSIPDSITPDTGASSGRSFLLSLEAENTVAAARVFDLMDVVLLPADEWLGYFVEPEGSGLPSFQWLVVDSATRARLPVSSWVEESGGLEQSYLAYAAAPAIFQSNPGAEGQRLWILQAGQDIVGGFTEQMSTYQYAIRSNVAGVHRYLSMRGNR